MLVPWRINYQPQRFGPGFEFSTTVSQGGFFFLQKKPGPQKRLDLAPLPAQVSFSKRNVAVFRFVGEFLKEDGWYSTPGSPVDQTKCLVFWMIHVFRILDPTNGQSLVDLDLQGTGFDRFFLLKFQNKSSPK